MNHSLTLTLCLTLIAPVMIVATGCSRSQPRTDTVPGAPPEVSTKSNQPAKTTAGDQTRSTHPSPPPAWRPPPANRELLGDLRVARGQALCVLASKVQAQRDAGLIGPALDRVFALRRDEASRDCGYELLTKLRANAALPAIAGATHETGRWLATLAWANRNLRAQLWTVYGLALHTADPLVRMTATTGLGNYAPAPEVLALLREAARDDNPMVRRRAIKALIEMGGPGAQETLQGRLSEEKDAQIRDSIRSALPKMSNQEIDVSKHTKPVHEDRPPNRRDK